jgi:hypothetical protein
MGADFRFGDLNEVAGHEHETEEKSLNAKLSAFHFQSSSSASVWRTFLGIEKEIACGDHSMH